MVSEHPRLIRRACFCFDGTEKNLTSGNAAHELLISSVASILSDLLESDRTSMDMAEDKEGGKFLRDADNSR